MGDPGPSACFRTLSWLVLGGLWGCATTLPASTPADLLTADQYALIEAEEDSASRGRDAAPVEEMSEAEAPRIIVEKPDLTAPIASPFGVRARFETIGGAKVRPETFAVKYKKGFVSLDITTQALEFIRVSENGAVAEAIPISKAGRHTLVLEVSDSQGRVGRTRMTFEVSGDR